MRFGLCCSVDDARAALDAGFDYVELPASALLDRRADYAAVRPEVTNVFFPGGYSVYGEAERQALEYAERVIAAAADVGVQVMVIGSAGARQAPDAVTEHEAEFVRVAAEIELIAKPYGIVIAPESLSRQECNVGTNLGTFATALIEGGLAYTADSYHVLTEWRLDGHDEAPPQAFWDEQLPFLPAHVHLGSRPRLDPRPDDPDLAGFVARLRHLEYDQRVSLECGRRDGQLLAGALQDVRNLFGHN